MAKRTKKNAAKLDRENQVTFTSFTYRLVKMYDGERIGKCPRGKTIACGKCQHIVVSNEESIMKKCLNFDVDEAMLYPLREEDKKTVHILAYNDSIIHQGIVADVALIGKVKDIKDPEARNRVIDGVSYTIMTVLQGVYPITLISE